MYPELIYSEIPENLSFIRSKKNCFDHPDAYAWILLLESEEENIPHICIDTWILADADLISEFQVNKSWFNNCIKDELEEKFIIDPSLNYLIKFEWEHGDRSVGIPDGYNCFLVLNSKNESVTRKWIHGEDV